MKVVIALFFALLLGCAQVADTNSVNQPDGAQVISKSADVDQKLIPYDEKVINGVTIEVLEQRTTSQFTAEYDGEQYTVPVIERQFILKIDGEQQGEFFDGVELVPFIEPNTYYTWKDGSTYIHHGNKVYGPYTYGEKDIQRYKDPRVSKFTRVLQVNGKLAFATLDGDGYVVVYDGKEVARHKNINTYDFRTMNGHLMYPILAQEGSSHVVDGVILTPHYRLGKFAMFKDSFVYSTPSNVYEVPLQPFTEFNLRPSTIEPKISPTYRNIRLFTDYKNQFAYTAWKDREVYVISNEKEYGPYESVKEGMEFRDGDVYYRATVNGVRNTYKNGIQTKELLVQNQLNSII
jgi:hypothetical protein